MGQLNIYKRHLNVSRLLDIPELSTKVYLYFATKVAGEDFDPYEKNYTYTNLNPLVMSWWKRR